MRESISMLLTMFRFVRRAEVLAEFVFNGLYSVWNNRVRKGGG
ncbi:hypothetical protein SPAR65_1286 [Streptococcus pneumoniae GA40563]|nr:hypothetical protein SPAR65_1286 [Streptococcus pneumoniae GA40563]